MALEVVRIDDRLIHGQIVQGWLKVINVDKILIISDEVAQDSMQQILMGMAVPSEVKLVIKNIKDASQDLIDDVYKNDKLMILFANPQDVVRVVKNGVNFRSVNLGGMHFSHGKTQILPNLSVDTEDVKAFLFLTEKSVELETRILPGDERYNATQDIIKEAKKLQLIG